MKLIVDAQLPVKLCEVLNQLGLESIHVDELPKGDETPDLEISEIADRENLIVLSKYYDFYHSHMTLGKPKIYFLSQQVIIKTECYLTYSEIPL